MSRTVVVRYALFQLPELLLVGIGLFALTSLEVITATLAWILLGAWVFKEVALYPFVRAAYEVSDPGGAAHLLGVEAVVTERLDPEGRVRVGPESWKARLPAGSRPAEPGARVCVKSVEGLTLHVFVPVESHTE